MKADYIHKDSTTLVQDELVKNEFNQIELQYNALKQQKFNELLKENQELKLELSGYRQAILNNEEMLGLKEQNDKLKKKYENAVADYETTMAEKNELNKQLEVSNELVTQGTLTEMKLRNEVNRWRKEYQDTYKDVRIEIKEYKNQQKEFINYLEDEIKTLEKDILETIDDMDIYMKQVKSLIIEEILQKYKEIIGE